MGVYPSDTIFWGRCCVMGEHEMTYLPLLHGILGTVFAFLALVIEATRPKFEYVDASGLFIVCVLLTAVFWFAALTVRIEE